MRKLIFSFVIIILASSAVFAAEKNSDTMKLLALFGDVFEKVREDYVEEVSDQKLVEAAINGMLTSLDPHSSYLNEKAFNDMQIQTKGEFGGLGIEVTMDNGLVKVVSPIDETPAAKAGIMPGDYISEIDGKPVMGMTLNDAVDKLRGKAGSKVTVTILRQGEKEPKEITMVRDVIKIKSVRAEKENDVAYLRITSFSEATDKNLKTEFEKIKKDVGASNLKGVVLDLRNNPGGLLDQAIGVANDFLDKGEIVSTRGRIADSAKRFDAKPDGDMARGLPVVVLINGGSASASEIVAGALQDHKRAVIMGTKSFGKGSVQTVIPLPGNGAMRLTTSRYYTPSGHSIQAKGIEPDITVAPAKIEAIKQKNSAEADLIRHLYNDQEKKKDGKKEDADKSEKKDGQSGLPDDSGEEQDNAAPANDNKSSADKKSPQEKSKYGVIDKDLYEKDYQLARAIDLIRAVSVFNGGADKPQAPAK